MTGYDLVVALAAALCALLAGALAGLIVGWGACFETVALPLLMQLKTLKEELREDELDRARNGDRIGH